jgi:hypothetical protein
VQIAAGTSSTQVYFTAQRAEVVDITATGTGITTDGAYTLTVDPAAAFELVFTTTALTVPLSTCSGVLTVQQRDQYGNAVPVAVNTPVGFADNGTNLDFHNSNVCGDAAQAGGTMLGGQSSMSFYVRSDTGQTDTQLTITLGAFTAQQLVTVAGLPRLFFTTPARAITGGECTLVVTVERQTGGGTPITGGGPLTVNLSSNATTNGTGGLTFHTDSLCGTAGVSSVQIPGGNSSTDLYVRANVAEAPTLTAQAGGFTDGTQGLTVTTGPAAKLFFTVPTSGQTLAQLACSSQVTVQLQDAGGNPVNAGGGGRTVTLAGSGGTNTTFYATANDCSNSTNAVTTRAMASGANTVTFFFKAESTASTTLTASIDGSPAATNATQVQTLTPAPPAKIVFTTADTTVEAGFCFPVVLERQDALNRAVSPASATTCAMTAASPAPAAPLLTTQYFSDASCTTLLAGNFDILAGQSSTTVYVKGRSGSIPGANQTAAQAYTIAATSSGLTGDSMIVTVNPMVRRGTCTIENNETSSATSASQCVVTPALAAIDRTMLFYQASAQNADSPVADAVTCRLTPNGGTALIICERLGSSGSVDDVIPVNWQLVSFPYGASQGGVSVQHLSNTFSTAASADMDITIGNAPLATSFLLFSARIDGTGEISGNDVVTGTLTSSTNLRYSLPTDGTFSGSTAATSVFESQVVTWSGASVAHGTQTGGSGATFTATQASPNLNQSFLLHSSRMATVGEGGNDMCARRLSGVITDGTTLTFQRGCASTANPGDNVGDISWERVEVPSGHSVQRLTATIGDNAQSQNRTIASVDRTRAAAFIGGQGFGGSAGGRSQWVFSDRIACAQANIDFNSATEIGVQRNATGGECNGSGSEGQGDFGVFVLEVTP